MFSLFNRETDDFLCWFMPKNVVPSLTSSRRCRVREWWEALPKPDEQEGGTGGLLFDGSSIPGGLGPDISLTLSLHQH